MSSEATTSSSSNKRQRSSDNSSSTASAAAPSTNAYAPSAAGSVIRATDSLTNTESILIRLQNITASVNLGVHIDLKTVALKCRNAEWNPKRFIAVVMRLVQPKATALIFESGKFSVTGCKTTHDAMLAAKKFAVILEKVGFKAEYLDFKVNNIVGSMDVGFPIRLEGLAYAHNKWASYEPELFPGLIYRLTKPRAVFLIFVTGKVVITGIKKETDISEAVSKIHPLLVEYRKSTVHTSFPQSIAGRGDNLLVASSGHDGGQQQPQQQLLTEQGRGDDDDDNESRKTKRSRTATATLGADV